MLFNLVLLTVLGFFTLSEGVQQPAPVKNSYRIHSRAGDERQNVVRVFLGSAT